MPTRSLALKLAQQKYNQTHREKLREINKRARDKCREKRADYNKVWGYYNRNLEASIMRAFREMFS